MSITDTPEQRAYQLEDKVASIQLNAALQGFELTGKVEDLVGHTIDNDDPDVQVMAVSGAVLAVAYQLSRIADALEKRQ